MKPHICPYLGSRDDPKTALDFPTEANCCYHARPVSPVESGHQANFCLTEQHAYCPVYAAKQLKPLPAALAAPAARSKRIGRALAFTLIPIVLVTLALVGTWVQRLLVASQFQNGAQSSGDTPFNFSIPNTGLFGQAARFTNTPYQPHTRTSPAQMTPSPMLASNCPIPAGWSPYIAKPTDSLFRLSVLYGISVQSLQQANCLSSQSVIKSGSVIFLPIPPTHTPSSTPSQTLPPPVLPGVTANPPQNNQPFFNEFPTQAPTATSIPPNLVPPTATSIPPTVVIPTQVPFTPIPPTLAIPTLAPVTPVLPTPVPPTPVPPTPVPPTPVPPTPVPPTPVPPTDIPPTSAPTEPPPPTEMPTSAPTEPPPPTEMPTTAPASATSLFNYPLPTLLNPTTVPEDPISTTAPPPTSAPAPTSTFLPPPIATLAPTTALPEATLTSPAASDLPTLAVSSLDETASQTPYVTIEPDLSSSLESISFE